MRLPLFFKKTYKIFSVFIFVTAFFVFYNTYLVDRSVINLKIALERAAEAKTKEDFAKIKPLLKLYLHKQIAQKQAYARELVLIEAAENLAVSAGDAAQAKDAQFYLRSIVDEITKKRGAFLSALDTLNSRIYAPQEGLSKDKLVSLEKKLLASLETIKDKSRLQEVYYNLGNVYIQSADSQKAEEAFLKAVQIDPEGPLAMKAKFNLAWAYKTDGRYEEAVKYFEEISSGPREDSLVVSGKAQIVDTYYKKGDYKEAVKRYTMLAAEGGGMGIGDIALYQAAYISFYTLNNPEEASEKIITLAREHPDSGLTRQALSELSLSMSKERRNEGFRLLDEKRFGEALESFKNALRLSPSDIHSLSGMSICLYWLNRKREAYFRARLVLKLAPIDELTVANSLFVLVNCGKVEQAIKAAEGLLLKIMPVTPQFYYNLGSAYYLKKDFNNALTQFRRVYELSADSAALRNKLGNVYWSMGNYGEAIKEFNKAIAMDERYALAYFNRGVVNFSVNKLAEAHSDFMNASGIDPIFKKAVQPYLERIKKSLKY